MVWWTAPVYTQDILHSRNFLPAACFLLKNTRKFYEFTAYSSRVLRRFLHSLCGLVQNALLSQIRRNRKICSRCNFFASKLRWPTFFVFDKFLTDQPPHYEGDPCISLHPREEKYYYGTYSWQSEIYPLPPYLHNFFSKINCLSNFLHLPIQNRKTSKTFKGGVLWYLLKSWSPKP